jgi:hypothetical protein
MLLDRPKSVITCARREHLLPRLRKKLVINHMDTAGTQFMSSSSAKVQFACYDENDPQYRQAVLRPDDGA